MVRNDIEGCFLLFWKKQLEREPLGAKKEKTVILNQ